MPPTAEAISLANLLVGAINNLELATGVAERVYFVDLELKNLAAPKTSVVVAAVRRGRSSRGGRQVEIDIDIGYQIKVNNTAEADAATATNDAIIDAIENDFSEFSFQQSERKFINDSEGIKSRKVFTAVTTLTFSFYE